MSADQLEGTIRADVQNIGGIGEATVHLGSGVSILTGENATNRTSFLSALMAGLGSNQASLKGNADEGSVSLEIDGQTYSRKLRRHNGTVTFEGEPYLDDPVLADLFAFLLENNEARRTIARGEDLRELIMRPVDTDRIDTEIESCKQQRQEVDDEIERLDQIEEELPALEARREQKEAELEDAQNELSSVRSEIEALETGVEQSRSQKQALEAAFQRVRDARSEREDLEFDLETERSTLAELQAERDDLTDTISELEEPTESPERLSGQIQELRERKQALGDTINELSSVVSFNEEMLDEEGLAVDRDSRTETPTERLRSDTTISCWTCGSDVSTDRIDETIDRLKDLRADKISERREITAEIEERSTKQSELRTKQREITRTEQRLADVEAEIESTRETIDELEARIEAQASTIEELEADAAAIEIDDHEETLELHRESNEIELRIERIESTLADLEDEITDRKAALEAREAVETKRDELTERLTRLRTKIERLETDAVDAFNEHMETVLDILEYDNLDRIWIERRQEDVRDGRRTVTKTRFDLHIVRSGADGVAYEDTVEHLSESEREVTGLVFGLAGYLVHEVHEVVPFIVLDSLEAIDSDRIARVVEYFETHADYLVAALLPEDAAALPERYTYITEID